MGKENSNHPAAPALENKQLPERGIESLHRHAMSLLDELDDEQGRVYAVAAAGRAYVGKDAVSESHLFSVIETLCEDLILTNALRGVVTNLAERAGSTWVKEVAA